MLGPSPSARSRLAGRVTALDVSLTARTLAVSMALTLGAGIVLTLSDEPTSSARERVARLGALTPTLAFVAGSLLRERMQRRGELLALESSGIPGSRGLLALRATTALQGLAGAAALLVGGSASALVPELPSPPFAVTASALHAPSLGFSLEHGVATWGSAAALAASPPPLAPIAAGLAMTALALSELVALRAALRIRVAAAATLGVLGLVALRGGPVALPAVGLVALGAAWTARWLRG